MIKKFLPVYLILWCLIGINAHPPKDKNLNENITKKQEFIELSKEYQQIIKTKPPKYFKNYDISDNRFAITDSKTNKTENVSSFFSSKNERIKKFKPEWNDAYSYHKFIFNYHLNNKMYPGPGVVYSIYDEKNNCLIKIGTTGYLMNDNSLFIRVAKQLDGGKIYTIQYMGPAYECKIIEEFLINNTNGSLNKTKKIRNGQMKDDFEKFKLNSERILREKKFQLVNINKSINISDAYKFFFNNKVASNVIRASEKTITSRGKNCIKHDGSGCTIT